MKRVILVVLGVALVLVAAGAIAVSRIDPETMRAYLVNATKDATGKPLYLAQTPQLSLMPLGVTFGAASWGMSGDKPAPEGFSVGVKGGSLKLQVLPLLSGRLVVEEIRLDSPQITLRPDKAVVGAPSATPEQPFALPREVAQLELSRLSISNGVMLLDFGQGQVIRIEGFNALVTDLRPGSEASVKLDMALNCLQPDLAGNLALAAHARMDAAGLQVRQLKTTFTQVRGPLAAEASPVQLALDATLLGRNISLDNIKVTAAGGSVSGVIKLGMGTIPSVKGALHLDGININELFASSKETPKAKTVTSPTPRTNVDSEFPSVDLELRAKSLIAGNIPIKQLHAVVRGEGGKAVRYTVSPLTVEMGTGGVLNSKMNIEVPLMRYEAEGTLKGLAVGPLLHAVKGIRPVEATAEAEYFLTCTGYEKATVVNSLSGRGQLLVRQISLNGVSLLPEGVPVKGTLPTSFERLTVPFTAHNGVISVNDMSLVGEGLSATGKGTVRLPQESLDMTGMIKALGMQVPVRITGSFSNPSYTVDPKWAAKMLLQAPGVLLEGGGQGGGKAGDAVKGLGGAVKGLFGR